MFSKTQKIHTMFKQRMNISADGLKELFPLHSFTTKLLSKTSKFGTFRRIFGVLEFFFLRWNCIIIFILVYI